MRRTLDKEEIGAKEVDEINSLRVQVKIKEDAKAEYSEYHSLEYPVRD